MKLRRSTFIHAVCQFCPSVPEACALEGTFVAHWLVRALDLTKVFSSCSNSEYQLAFAAFVDESSVPTTAVARHSLGSTDPTCYSYSLAASFCLSVPFLTKDEKNERDRWKTQQDQEGSSMKKENNRNAAQAKESIVGVHEASWALYGRFWV